VKQFGKVNYKNKTPQYSIGQVSGAGFFSVIPMTLINAPFERVKIMLQLQGQDVRVLGTLEYTKA
jgi:solute carrier family 25 (mitochondrial carnitine/acylcarnitine transporter), member 20/29